MPSTLLRIPFVSSVTTISFNMLPFMLHNAVLIFAPPRFQQVLSCASGWLGTLTWESSVAVECLLAGKVLLALVMVNDGTGFEAPRWR